MQLGIIVSTALASSLLEHVSCHNFSSAEQQFQHHINFLKEVLPRRKTLELNNANSLVSISHEGVPINFDRVLLENKLPPIANADQHNFNMTSDISPNGPASLDPSATGSLIYISPLSLLVAETLHSMTTSQEQHFEIPTALASDNSYNSNQEGTQTRKFDPLAEIRRLESLLIDLKEHTSRQELAFRKQMERIVQDQRNESALRTLVTPVTTKSKQQSPVVSSSADNENPSDTYWETSTTKVNGRQIMTKKTPSNSVIIMPQFQHHTKQRVQPGSNYHKPKIAWSEVPTVSTTDLPHVEAPEILGVIREGEYTILFDNENQIGYIDSNAIQFAEVTDANAIPSTTQYEEYFARQTSLQDYDNEDSSIEDISSDTDFDNWSEVNHADNSAMSRSPSYDQDLIHLPLRHAASSAMANQIESYTAAAWDSATRNRRPNTHITKSFNFDVFDFEPQSIRLNLGTALRRPFSLIRYILLMVLL